MAPALGKRKRVTRAELEQPSRSPSPSSASGDDSGAEDLQAIDYDAINHPRELNRIRDELAAERAAHADTRAALAALKALGPEEPPF